jgi:hypothetical protein
MKKIAWKVVKVNDKGFESLYSHHYLVCHYFFNKITRAPDKNHPLFCLRTRQDARNYLSNIFNKRRRIVKVEMIESNPPPFPCPDIPYGTVFAKQVKVIK